MFANVQDNIQAASQIKRILADHSAWLADNSKGKRADLRHVMP